MNKEALANTENTVITLLRGVLGIMFLWLGLMKIAEQTHMIANVNGGIPYFAISGGGMVLGVIEAVVGLLFLVNMFWWLAEILLVLFLLGVVFAFFAATDSLFSQKFPQLTTMGEMLLKSLALGIAGLSVMIHENRIRKIECDCSVD